MRGWSPRAGPARSAGSRTASLRRSRHPVCSGGSAMFFDTPVYAFFLALVVLIYWRLGWRSQNRFLLAASYIFYGWWDVRFLGLIAISTVVDYYCAQAIAASTEQRKRRLLL